MENTSVIETHGLTKRFANRVLAVDSLAMSVRRGEVYGFLGSNGAEKRCFGTVAGIADDFMEVARRDLG